MRIDQDVKHIAGADIHSVLKLSNPAGKTEGVIKVNHNYYKISVGENGELSVKTANSWWRCNFFRKKSLNRMRDAMQAQYDTFRTAYGNALKPAVQNDDVIAMGIPENDGQNDNQPITNAMQTVTDRTDSAIDKLEGEGVREIALYGFSQVRERAGAKLTARNVNFTLIDDYNTACGLTSDYVGATSLQRTIDSIRSGELKINSDGKSAIPEEKLQKWAAFLQRNAGKLDIFAKIISYQQAEDNPKANRKKGGWIGEAARNGYWNTLRAIVKKNIPGSARTTEFGHKLVDKDIEAIATAISTLAAYAVKGEPLADRERYRNLILKCVTDVAGYKGQEAENVAKELEWVTDMVLCNMFFRQTSKLGLDFFKEEGIPVMFQWSTHEGISLEKATNELGDKWWKNDNSSIQDHYGATITFSEMRHVQKMEAQQKNDPLNAPPQIAKVYGIEV